MKTRAVPLSAILGIIFSVIFAVVYFLPNPLQLVLYFVLALADFYGVSKIITSLVFYALIPASFIVGLLVSVVTVFIAKSGSDRARQISKTVCDIAVTVCYMPYALALLSWLAFYILYGVTTIEAWTLTIFELFALIVLYIVVLWFLSRHVHFRVQRTFGNTTLAIFLVGYILFTLAMMGGFIIENDFAVQSSSNAMGYCMAFVFLTPFPIAVLSVFDRAVQDEDGKLKKASKVLLTLIISDTAVITLIALIHDVIYIAQYGFTELRIAALLMLSVTLAYLYERLKKILA